MTAPVAIAVVSWNTRDLLAACLRSLRPDVEAGRAEVWVVDNGSRDGSPELVREAFPWATLLLPEDNLGYGPAVNLVAAATRSEWVAPSNADVELEPGALAALLRAGQAHPEAGLIGPRLVLPDGSTQPGAQPFPGVLEAVGRNLGLHRVSGRVGERLYLRGYWDPDQPGEADWLTGAFFLVRRRAWDAVGGFDESQWMYAEDLDLCWRVRHAGWTVRYEPSALVRHHLSVATAQAFGDAERRWTRMVRANYLWLAQRRGAGTAWVVGIAQLLTLWLRRLSFLALGARGDRRAAAKARETGRLLRRQRAGLRALRQRDPGRAQHE
jgi:GT2 family glycosyltransferase